MWREVLYGESKMLNIYTTFSLLACETKISGIFKKEEIQCSSSRKTQPKCINSEQKKLSIFFDSPEKAFTITLLNNGRAKLMPLQLPSLWY